MFVECSSDTFLELGSSVHTIELRHQYLLSLCAQFITSQAKIESVCTICTQKWNPDVQVDVVRDVEGIRRVNKIQFHE